jgi:hypothetical protein
VTVCVCCDCNLESCSGDINRCEHSSVRIDVAAFAASQARALACNLNASFMKVVASAIVDKYIGESARLIREVRRTGRPPWSVAVAPLSCTRMNPRSCGRWPVVITTIFAARFVLHSPPRCCVAMRFSCISCRCFSMPERTHPVSFSWTRSTPSAALGCHKVRAILGRTAV